MADITFEIKKTLGVIAESPKGWKKELNLISWNGNEPKYDIRGWSPEHTRMGKGITFTKEELVKLQLLLSNLEWPNQKTIARMQRKGNKLLTVAQQADSSCL